jgi:hypothetical protein
MEFTNTNTIKAHILFTLHGAVVPCEINWKKFVYSKVTSDTVAHFFRSKIHMAISDL